jgi:lipooligosaccharide transport system permease protein
VSTTERVRRIHRLEPAALVGVMSRDVVLFRRYWKATTFSSIVQPAIYLLAFGLGFGSLVSHVGHVRYVEYVATGVVATAVLFASAFPGMFNTLSGGSSSAPTTPCWRRPSTSRS